MAQQKTNNTSYGIITATDVSFHYDEERSALQDVSLYVAKGKHIAILGANGSGKSTLARHLNALLLPSAGSVIIDDINTRELEKTWEIRKKVGMVFQNPENQIVGATVEDDIVFGMENIGLERGQITIRLERVVEQMQLSDIRYKEPHQLSGGQKQRVAIAGVLAMEPDVLVLDEATSMLDPEGRQEVLSALKSLLENSSKTIVQITHDIEEAILADEVFVLKEGQIAMQGKPEDIFTLESNLQVYGLQRPFSMRFYQEFLLTEASMDAPGLMGNTVETKVPMNMKELVERLCEYNAKR